VSNSERILIIGKYLVKLWARVWCLVFLTHGVQYKHYVNSHISTQHRASVLFLLESLFVRDGVLSCPLLSADDIDMFVDFMCIS